MKDPKRSQALSSLLASLSAIVVGLLFGLVILLVSNPAQAMRGLGSILRGGFIDWKNFGQVFYFATPIIMTGLSVAFANKCGLFNIGAAGQFIVGAFAAVYVGIRWTFLPGGLHWVVALLAAMLAGALWGSVPGLLKARRNVNEVITCIMLNYTGMYLVNLLVRTLVYDSLKNQSLPVASSAVLPKAGLNTIFRTGNSASSVNVGIFIAIAAGIAIWVILSKTKFGFELKAVGLNRDASRYAGIGETASIVKSMAIAGALSGLGGALLYLAGSGKSIEVLDVLAAEGFNGIPVALLGLNNPIGVILAGVVISHLNVGGNNMQLYGFAPQAIEIIIAVIIYFSAFSLLFRGVFARIGRRGAKGDRAASDDSGAPEAGRDTPASGPAEQ